MIIGISAIIYIVYHRINVYLFDSQLLAIPITDSRNFYTARTNTPR